MKLKDLTMAAAAGYPGASPPPDGVVPNLEHPTDVLWTVNVVTQCLTLIIVTVFVVTRYYTKLCVLQTARWTSDDWATYVAYAVMVGYCITGLTASVRGGAGLNQWEVTKTEITPCLKSFYAATIFYAPMALFVKLALLLIIARVFGPVHKKTRYGIFVFMGFITAYYISGVIVKIRICWPVSAYWTGHPEKCLDQSAIVLVDSIISVISDIAILLLPLPLTWSLQMPRKRKMRVVGMLCAGGVATAFSFYRLVMIVEEGASSNMTILFTKVILTGNAEAGIALICACLPACSTLILRTGSTNRSGYGKMGSSGYGKMGSNAGFAKSVPSSSGGIAVDRSIQQTTQFTNQKEGGEPWAGDNIQLVSYAQSMPNSKGFSKETTSTAV